MTDIEKQIRERVEEFVQDISELVRAAALQSISEALGEATAQAPKKKRAARGAPASRPSRAGGGKRTPAELQSQGRQIVALVKKQSGIRADQMAATMGLGTRDLALPIKKLLADRVIHKKGQKRATAYYVGKGR